MPTGPPNLCFHLLKSKPFLPWAIRAPFFLPCCTITTSPLLQMQVRCKKAKCGCNMHCFCQKKVESHSGYFQLGLHEKHWLYRNINKIPACTCISKCIHVQEKPMKYDLVYSCTSLSLLPVRCSYILRWIMKLKKVCEGTLKLVIVTKANLSRSYPY